MALVVYWYDCVCFGIVAAAFLGSLWVLWRKEAASRCEDDSVYESLLAAQQDADGFVHATPTAHVGSNQLWTSCWKGVHPGWLVLTRFVSFAVLAGFLSWDIVEWDASIFVYYTESGKTPIIFIIFPTYLPVPNLPLLSSKCRIRTMKAWGTGSGGKYQAFAFICTARILCEVIASEGGAFAFYFYTQWTFALVMVYFGLGTVISAYGCWVCLNTPLPENGARAEFLKSDVEESRTENSGTYKENNVRDKIKLQSHHAQEEFQRRAGFWGYLMQTIYQTCAGAVILTDIVFWCVIVPFLSNSHLGLNTLMGCMHTLNAMFLILDTLLNSLPFPWFRLAYFVQWSCLYVVFQWVLHACGFTWWPYPFLELNTPWAPLWYFALALVHIPCYGMYALIVKAKNSILPRLFPHAFVRSH
ncbi:Chaperone DnaK [Gossypium arboreum]|uniref:Chaperone DnaK n=1 Tax=Gossypium arboreum TaxID=29729 RepID=A0A0B0P032_GOSAR|nr:Chaperone DnaK [Gossypium arboreum]